MTNIEEKTGGKIEGLHTFSICDIRHPQSKTLEQEIEQTIGMYRNALKRAKSDFYLAKAREATKDEIALLTAVMADLRQRWHKEVGQMYSAMRDLTLVNQFTVHNIIPTAGRAVIAEWITGDITHSADNGANYGSLGTSNTAVANGDTTLTTETYRKATSSAATASNVAFLSNFYTATEVTGTFEEAGWHIDGTASADTGELLSHFLTTTISKSSTETLTAESTLTIS